MERMRESDVANEWKQNVGTFRWALIVRMKQSAQSARNIKAKARAVAMPCRFRIMKTYCYATVIFCFVLQHFIAPLCSASLPRVAGQGEWRCQTVIMSGCGPFHTRSMLTRKSSQFIANLAHITIYLVILRLKQWRYKKENQAHKTKQN